MNSERIQPKRHQGAGCEELGEAEQSLLLTLLYAGPLLEADATSHGLAGLQKQRYIESASVPWGRFLRLNWRGMEAALRIEGKGGFA